MRPTPKSRKPVTEITPEDLETYPIWEYVDDEETLGETDETWVRPVIETKIPRNAYSQIVAADFKTASGIDAFGFMMVTTAKAKIEIQAGSLVSNQYIVLPKVSREIAMQNNSAWSIKNRDKVASLFQSPERQVFPIRYSLRAVIEGEAQLRAGVVA